MKKLFPIFVLSLFAFVACDDDDDKNLPLSKNVVEFIESKYNSAVIRHSEYDDNGLIEVEILHESLVKDVYFTTADEWVYTSWDVRLANLPAVVKEAVTNTYPDFVLEEADYVERPNLSYYAVEIEKGNADVIVYVSPEGEILDASTGEPGTKPVLSDAVRSFIAEKYPAAKIVEYSYTVNGLLEVDIVDGVIEKDVYFDSNDAWVQTDWDVSADTLPDAVLKAIAELYPQYFVDSAEYVERPEGVVFYTVELEQGNTEIVVNVTPDGEVLK